MYVGLKMLRLGDFPVLSPDTSLTEANRLMNKHRMWMLLVTDKGKLVGCLNKDEVRSAMPSQATTLDKHELNYLLSKLTVKKIYNKDVVAVPPQTEIEEAAEIMYERNIAGMAVVDSSNNLLGYINRSVMLDVLVDEMGLRQGGSRIVFEVEDRAGVIHEVSGIIADMGVSIISTGTFFQDGRRIVVFRVKADDPTPIAKAIHDRGYALIGPELFAKEWSQ